MKNATKSFALLFVMTAVVLIPAYLIYQNSETLNQYIQLHDNKTIIGNNSQPKIKSAFYGMNHRETYGLPLSYFGLNQTFKIDEEEWKTYFPQLVFALEKLKIANAKSDHLLIITDSFKVHLINDRFNIGEEFTAKITSFDKQGKQKPFGGDYFRARLFKGDHPYPDGIPCSVFDNNDGTYFVKAPLVLDGSLTLEVKLVLPVEGINAILKQTDGKLHWGVDFIATFSNKETAVCNLMIDKANKSDLCDYSNPRNHEPWFCFKPASKRCPQIADVKHDSSEGPPLTPTVNFTEIYSRNGAYKVVKLLINVGQNAEHAKIVRFLPTCHQQYLANVPYNRVTGFMKGGVWNSLNCATSGSNSSLRSCFSNKDVYFFGDSTIRQFFYYFVRDLKLKVEGPNNGVIWQQPQYAHDNQAKNISIFYRAHGPPLRNPGPPYTRPYLSDSIIDLPEGGKNIYVVLNVGAHLIHVSPNLYVHRVKGIKSAIQEHHEKFSETKFIVRGMNVVEGDLLKNFNWQLYRIEILLRAVFSDLKNVVFLNFWDMTTVWTLPDLHPTSLVLNMQATHMLSYICYE